MEHKSLERNLSKEGLGGCKHENTDRGERTAGKLGKGRTGGYTEAKNHLWSGGRTWSPSWHQIRGQTELSRMKSYCMSLDIIHLAALNVENASNKHLKMKSAHIYEGILTNTKYVQHQGIINIDEETVFKGNLYSTPERRRINWGPPGHQSCRCQSSAGISFSETMKGNSFHWFLIQLGILSQK